jgi:perosamine synthetase
MPAAIMSERQVRKLDSAAVIAAIRSVVGPSEKPIGLHEPVFRGNEQRYVMDCLETGWVSYNGAYVKRFEEMLCAATGAASCAAMVNGTVAIEMALRVIGVRPGDEVLSPSLTFVATNNAIVHVGAIPHFIDSEPTTLGVDVEKLARHLEVTIEASSDGPHNRRTGRRVSAILPMHCFGHPVDMDPLLELASRFEIPVIEDATEAIGSRYKGRPAGGLASVGCLSFNGNKIITTGGGGAVLTQDPALGEKLRYLTTTAKQPHPFEFIHDAVAWNYRLPNINAAVGCGSMERLDELIDAKRRLQARYEAAFESVAGATLFSEAEGSRSNYWLVTLLLDSGDTAARDRLLQACHDAKLLCRAAWRLNHQLPMYGDCPRMDLAGAEALQPRIVNLPSSPTLVA